jgi:pilus assembly protein FimV
VTAGAAEYGPVQSGQTLWSIASDWSRGSGLDVNKVMLAIQRENPHAFLNDNINLLKRGAILRMPSVTEVESIPTAAAYQEVAAQHASFRGFAAPATAASPATPLLAGAGAGVESEAQEPEASGLSPEAPETTTPAAADEPTAAEETGGAGPALEASPELEEEAAEAPLQRDLLELVPPSADSDLDSAYGFEEGEGGAGADVQALREELARKEEELIAQQQQAAHLEERLQELESQLESAAEGRVADADLANMEERLREQRQAAAPAQPEPGKPWYSRMVVWLVALLVLAAAFVGWLVSRRGHSAAASGTAQGPLRDIKSEAEEVLRVLGAEREGTAAAEQAAATAGAGVAADEAGPPAAGAGDQAEDTKAAGRFAAHEEDAELLDEESSDPEIQLDLARAYISMGDKEAARVILEEVVNNGSEDQQAEARKMLDLLA